MDYGLIGEHLSHSYSKQIHASIADYKYDLIEVKRTELENFMRNRDFLGINVTIPYKEAVIPLLDYVDDLALRIGAVNTVVNRDGRLYGYNTDADGLKALLEKNHITVRGRKVLILGTGGTSKTATSVAESLGAREILKVSRSGKEQGVRQGKQCARNEQGKQSKQGESRKQNNSHGENFKNQQNQKLENQHSEEYNVAFQTITGATFGTPIPAGTNSGYMEKVVTVSYDEAYRNHNDAEIIINTTPAGMYPNDEADVMPIDPARFPNLAGAVDVIYHPLRTAFVLKCAELGVPACGGLYMLSTQAVYASARFLGRETIDPELINKAYFEALGKFLNIVLIGMPSSGKSTVGRLLSEKTGLSFIDTDEEITARIGIPISDYFAKYGEQAFRNVESDVIRELSQNGGRVIATGGGAVLRNKNVLRLQKNGILFFLDRPLNSLCPSNDRPLSRDAEALKKLYNTRYEIYKNAADEVINVNVGEHTHTPLETAKLLVSRLKLL